MIINAIMLGLSRKQARERFDDIIAFAELEEFIDLKLKNYSSGMYVRLAFATAVQVDADILLIDEVLAVGDAAFQQKCFDEFTRLHKRRGGRSCSSPTTWARSSASATGRCCSSTAAWSTSAIRPRSHASTTSTTSAAPDRSPAPQHEIPPENPPAEVLNARYFESGTGETALTSTQGESCLVRMEVRFAEDLENPIFAITLLNEAGQPVFITNTDSQHISTGKFAAGTEATIDMRFDNWLAPGRYRLVATVARAGLGADIFDAHMINSIIVIGDKPGGGITDLPHTLGIERR